MASTSTVPVAFFRRPSTLVAPELLNKIVVADGTRWARIVEVEAYAETDPASHAFRGPSIRNNVMFGPPGHLYVYFTYGMHWCANVVTGPAGSGQAVLLRAAEPLRGLDSMHVARRSARPRDLCRGPARLAQALGISGADNGSVVAGRAAGRIRVVDDGTPPPEDPACGPRVGITKAAAVPWRWWVPGSPWVSAFKAGGRRRSTGTGPPDRP